MLSLGDEFDRLDAEDPLQRFRVFFDLPEGVVYLDGNSLGALPKAALERACRTVGAEWGQTLISSWNDHGWIDLPLTTGARIAPLVGAKPSEVVVADSVSINLFKVVSAALEARPDRKVIVTDPGNFPTDLYILEGLAASRGQDVSVRYAPAAEIEAALGPEVAAVCLSHVDYRSARIADMAAITRAAHDAGALAVWDLSHSLGAIEVDLNGAGADFAVGCGYKYLNGGPGAPAMLFVAERHQADARQPLSGWMGHAAPFEFVVGYSPAPGIRRFLTGTPPIVSLSILEESVKIIAQAPMRELREKSQRLTSMLIALIEDHCAEYGFRLVSPRDKNLRGSHVLFDHPDGYAIVQALKRRGVIGDFRAPEGMRFGVAPLYNTFGDIREAVCHLLQVMENREYDLDDLRVRASVT